MPPNQVRQREEPVLLVDHRNDVTLGGRAGANIRPMRSVTLRLLERALTQAILALGFVLVQPLSAHASIQSDARESVEAPSQRTDPRWGILAELAGRDFDGCPTEGRCRAQMTIRWEESDRTLVVDSQQDGIRRTDTIRLDPRGALRLERDDHGRGYWSDGAVTLAADGSVLFLLSGTWIEQWRLLPSGRLEVEAGRQTASHGYRRHSRRQFTDVRFASTSARERLAGFRARLSAQSAALNNAGAGGEQASAGQTPRPTATDARHSILPAISTGGHGVRVALVIGVSVYGTLENLSNPGNDARAVAAMLRRVGFEVELLVDPDEPAMRQAISRLGERMSRAGSRATGLFFFAGHGIQARGVNYLIPAGARVAREADLALEAITADSVLLQMQEADVSTNILILDACRNMPLTRSFRNSARGLAPMEAPSGSFIAYSTAPGAVAADGDGENSPFAAALVAEIPRPGQPIEAIFRNVRRSVLEATTGNQTPWDSSSLLDAFYFVPR